MTIHIPTPAGATVAEPSAVQSSDPKSRAPWLILICAALAVLVWLDNANVEPDNELALIRTPAASVKPKDGWTLLRPTSTTHMSDARKTAIPAINALATIKPAQLHDTLSRPLFVRSRTAYRPPPPPPRMEQKIVVRAAPPPPRKPPPYKLMGIVLGGKTRIALLHPLSGAADLSVKQGDTLGQWHVKFVHSDAITLTDGVVTSKLKVFPTRKRNIAAVQHQNRRAPTRRWRRDFR